MAGLLTRLRNTKVLRLWQPGFNGTAFAHTPGLPKGILQQPQPVFAGAGIPDKVPMTKLGRLALQQRGDQSAPVG